MKKNIFFLISIFGFNTYGSQRPMTDQDCANPNRCFPVYYPGQQGKDNGFVLNDWPDNLKYLLTLEPASLKTIEGNFDSLRQRSKQNEKFLKRVGLPWLRLEKDLHGMGVRCIAGEMISKGTYIRPYTGEVKYPLDPADKSAYILAFGSMEQSFLDSKQDKQRYSSSEMNNNLPKLLVKLPGDEVRKILKSEKLYIDALNLGNESRFIQHAPAAIDPSEPLCNKFANYDPFVAKTLGYKTSNVECAIDVQQYEFSTGGLVEIEFSISLWIVANKDIQAGEELLLDYGETYWKKCRQKPSLKNNEPKHLGK